MNFYDLKIRISSNYKTEEEVMEKFDEWLEATSRIKTSLWMGNSCIVMLGVDKVEEVAAVPEGAGGCNEIHPQ